MSKNQNLKSQSDVRQDTALWKRVSHNLKALSSLRQECSKIDAYIKDLTSQIELANPEASEKITAKLTEELKNGRKCALEMRSKVQKTKDDMNSLSKLGALGDYASMSDLNFFSDNSSSRPSNSKNPSSNTPPKKFSIPIGATVAAKMLEPKETVQVWILATIIHYYAEKNKYQVEDVEADEADGENHKYILSARHVLQIPDEKILSYDNEFQIGQEVLALYPNTSCFYKATVLSLPSKNKARAHHALDYGVHFDDDDEEKRFVPRQMVIEMPTSSRSR